MNKRIKQILGAVIIGIISFNLVGCDNNDSEVKEFREQITKLEQQIEESEKEAQKEKCAFCNKKYNVEELNVRYIGTAVEGHEGEVDYYYCNNCVSNESKEQHECFGCGKNFDLNTMTPYQNGYMCESCIAELQEAATHHICDYCGKEKDLSELTLIRAFEKYPYACKNGCEEDFVCPICGGVNTCPENSECLNTKDPNYICDMCGKTGTCTPSDCFTPEAWTDEDGDGTDPAEICPYCGQDINYCICCPDCICPYTDEDNSGRCDTCEDIDAVM